jgi:septum formation protein
LVLASTSPRRKQFLEALGIPFTTVAPGADDNYSIDETPLPGESPAALVQRLSREKTQSVLHNLAARLPNAENYAGLVIVGADTEVVLEERILGKPTDAFEAITMLQQLRDQPHRVYSGLTVARPPRTMITRLHISQVWMRPYSNQEIDQYVSNGSSLDKAGAYGIQDLAFAPVARLEGCYASVMGFPLGEFADALHKVGLALPAVGPLCHKLTSYPCCRA